MVMAMANVTIFDTDLQNKIATLLAAGEAPLSVSRICECSDSTVYEVKNSAKFAQLCYNFAISKLMSEGAKAAVDTLIEIAIDKRAPKQARVSASDKLLSYTGYHISESGKLDKSPASMTQEELRNRLKALQDEAAQRSKPVVIDAEAVHIDDDDYTNLLD